jgi:hypothetical protein
MWSYLGWRRRNEARSRDARSIEELPSWFGSFARFALPRAPNLAPGEEIYFDFGAHRLSTGKLAYFHSYGRLTLTSMRLTFRIGWFGRIFFVFKPPASVGEVEIGLETVEHVDTVPWMRRTPPSVSGMPGATMAEFTLDDGQKVRFGGITKRHWGRAMETLRETHPRLDSLAQPP